MGVAVAHGRGWYSKIVTVLACKWVCIRNVFGYVGYILGYIWVH